jgi:hypothetical protein
MRMVSAPTVGQHDHRDMGGGTIVTREEREKLITQMQADNDLLVADAAEREARALLCDEPTEWQAPQLLSHQQSYQLPLSDAQLDRRCDQRIAKYLDENPIFTEKQADTLGLIISELRQEWQEYVDQKVGELRAELEVLRSVVKSNNVDLIKRGQDVA